MKKALSIRQPWAFAIMKGAKDIENRDWYTYVRGEIYIHTGKKEEVDDVEMVIHNVAMHLNQPYEAVRAEYEANKNLGCILGTVELVDCVDESDSSWFTGDHGFVLKNPKPVTPFPYRGQLNFFKVEEEPVS